MADGQRLHSVLKLQYRHSPEKGPPMLQVSRCCNSDSSEKVQVEFAQLSQGCSYTRGGVIEAIPIMTGALSSLHQFLERRRVRTIQNLSAEKPNDSKSLEYVSSN